MTAISDELYEHCLRVLHNAGPERQYWSLAAETPPGFREALAAAFDAAHEHVTSYTLNYYPDLNSIDSALCAVAVEHTGGDRWAVRHVANRSALSHDGEWDYEPPLSSRDEYWLDTHRFGRVAALELGHAQARRLAEEVTTVRSAIDRRAS